MLRVKRFHSRALLEIERRESLVDDGITPFRYACLRVRMFSESPARFTKAAWQWFCLSTRTFLNGLEGYAFAIGDLGWSK